MKYRKWHIAPEHPEAQQRLQAAGYPYLVSAVLAARGVETAEQAAAFLEHEQRLTYSPFLMADMDKAVARLQQALGIGDLWPLMEKEEPNIVANLGNYYPSMAQDAVLHQRQTEISVLNGAIARYGERLGVPTPFNTVITKVISCIQNNYDKQYLG